MPGQDMAHASAHRSYMVTISGRGTRTRNRHRQLAVSPSYVSLVAHICKPSNPVPKGAQLLAQVTQVSPWSERRLLDTHHFPSSVASKGRVCPHLVS
jgi:hypothetical protein